MIGNNVAKFRNERGKSLGQMGKDVGVGRSHLSKIENGQRLPSFELLFRLLKYFNCEFEDLFYKKDD